jgi:DNA-binding MarR family transcriptional regulator
MQSTDAPGDVTWSMQSALATIERRGILTLGELAEVEKVTPPTMTRVVTRLVDSGLVHREVDPADRRVVRVRMTVDGKRHLQQVRKRRNEWLGDQLRALSESDRQRLFDALPVIQQLAGDEA